MINAETQTAGGTLTESPVEVPAVFQEINFDPPAETTETAERFRELLEDTVALPLRGDTEVPLPIPADTEGWAAAPYDDHPGSRAVINRFQEIFAVDDALERPPASESYLDAETGEPVVITELQERLNVFRFGRDFPERQGRETVKKALMADVPPIADQVAFLEGCVAEEIRDALAEWDVATLEPLFETAAAVQQRWEYFHSDHHYCPERHRSVEGCFIAWYVGSRVQRCNALERPQSAYDGRMEAKIGLAVLRAITPLSRADYNRLIWPAAVQVECGGYGDGHRSSRGLARPDMPEPVDLPF